MAEFLKEWAILTGQLLVFISTVLIFIGVGFAWSLAILHVQSHYWRLSNMHGLVASTMVFTPAFVAFYLSGFRQGRKSKEGADGTRFTQHR